MLGTLNPFVYLLFGFGFLTLTVASEIQAAVELEISVPLASQRFPSGPALPPVVRGRHQHCYSEGQ